MRTRTKLLIFIGLPVLVVVAVIASLQIYSIWMVRDLSDACGFYTLDIDSASPDGAILAKGIEINCKPNKAGFVQNKIPVGIYLFPNNDTYSFKSIAVFMVEVPIDQSKNPPQFLGNIPLFKVKWLSPKSLLIIHNQPDNVITIKRASFLDIGITYVHKDSRDVLKEK